MATPTLAQANAALAVVRLINTQLTDLNNQLAQVQAQITALQTYSPANDLAAANATATGLTTEVGFLNTALTNQEATITAYNNANPGAPIPTS